MAPGPSLYGLFSISDYIDLDRWRHGNSQNDTWHNDTQLTIGMSQAAFMALGKMTFIQHYNKNESSSINETQHNGIQHHN
jgi:hypothetical protein